MTAKKKECNQRHEAKLAQINLKPYQDEAEAIKAAAARSGQSTQGYILDAVRHKMGSDDTSYKVHLPKDVIDRAAKEAGKAPKEYLAEVARKIIQGQ